MSQERRKRMKEDDEEESMNGEEFLFGNTEMGVRVRNKDWSTTPLGNPSQWPQSLRTAASMCLHNRFPTLIVWGQELTQIYNDGYSRLLQHRHPAALGAAYKDCWADIWAAVEHLYMGVVNTGEALYLEDASLWMNNNENIPQERYFTYSFSPIYIEGSKIGGVLNTVTETTERILNNRQLKLLRELGSHTTEATRMNDASRIIANVLTPYFQDVPFASIYFTDTLGQLVLASTVHIDQGSDCCPTIVSASVEYSSIKQKNLITALLRVAQSDNAEYFDLEGYEVPKVHPGIPENSHVRGCMLMPIEMTHGTTAGVMLVAVSPNRAFDETYRGFFKLLAGQTATLIGNAKSHEEERRKAEILAELDRAKTLFFSNISHEFRTPITLMLGPIEDLITKERDYAEAHEMLDQLELIHRNALRLLKLVNTLLDFSRIEAGRMEASFYPVNLSRLTEDLASVFRSAAERVGLEFIVDCEDLSEAVYVDNDMYEKIVLNLISNAYKFTLRGHIAVRIKQLGQQGVQLSVEDTGTGIPEEELPKIFDRFHRVPESKGRTHEGTGIGLAMVSELVKLHGGTIQAYSRVGKGTLFVVTLNYGTQHLPQERVRMNSRTEVDEKRRPSYVRTEEWWLGADAANVDKPKVAEATDAMAVEKTDKPIVLIVDDNADMREYIYKLLNNDYNVLVACDGLQALEIVSRQTPELILSDIMMPKLDGFGLLQRLREDPKTKTIPIIFLSARAGEEARVEGLKSGADDYLVKPFTARELQARIKTHIDLQRVRRESAERSEQANRAKDHFLAVLSHELRTPLTPALMLAESLENNEALPDTVRRDLEMITHNIKLEVRLIDDLLDVTKITKNKLVLSLKPVNVHKELEHTLQLVKHDAEQKNITLHTSFTATSVTMDADNSRLQQIFWNIVKNAVKFTPRDGHISITTLNEEADQITVRVTDSGIGVEPNALPTIFDSFQQGGSAITYQFGGLGLGLSICKALTTMMHGTIAAHSEGRGNGATFTVTFPTIQTAAQSPPRDDLSPSAVNVAPQRILMVEDNKSTALVMTRFLKKLGHDVKTAYSVKEALELAEAFKFDMVISDVGLPDGSGFDLMKSLHSMYGLRGVCVSGYGMEEDVKKSKECGFDFHLVKPVEIHVLQTAIAHVVKTKTN